MYVCMYVCMYGETTSVLVSIAKYIKQAVVDDDDFIGMVFWLRPTQTTSPFPSQGSKDYKYFEIQT